jgi:plastocyanin
MRMFYRPALLVAMIGMMASCGSNSNSSTGPSNQTTGTSNNAAVEIPQSDIYGSTNFNPQMVNINAGGAVSFSNNDGIEHHPTADDGSWNGDLPAGASFSQSFKTAGTYTYHCSIHPNMTGTITVK